MLNETNYTFWKLINEYSISIPMLQRDYAQGRQDAKTESIRKTFLDALIEAINTEPIKPINLDFVYGSLLDEFFIPLDGQQRLTTLFLLHWYLAGKTGNLINEEIAKRLKGFSYETRISSRDFCQALVEAKNLDFALDFDKIKISQAIKDASWFFHAWKKDPTVQAMLVMLDAIQDTLKKVATFQLAWKRLTEENCITFHFLPMNNFGLTDELYIKMNARGKALTDFENFKAKLEQRSEDFEWQNSGNKTWQELLDTDWADLFWQYRNKINDNYLIDDEYMNFFEGMALCLYPSEAKLDSRNNLLFDKAELTFIFETLEQIKLKINEINNELKDMNFYSLDKRKEQNLFENFINDANGKITYKNRVYFYALAEFLLKWKNVEGLENLKPYMRVVRNLVENLEVTNSNLENVTNSIKHIVALTGEDFYTNLANDKSNIGGFEQLKEERLKAKILLQNTQNQKAIFETEDNDFFRGRIIFALFCIDSDTEIDKFDAVKLSNINNIFITYFSGNNFSNDIRRAFFTIEKNDFYNYWWSWSYTTDTQKRCLIENITDLKNNFVYGNWRSYFKILTVQMVNTKPEDIAKNYICPSDMPNWKQRLIKDINLLDKHCRGHYIGISADDKFCLLFGDKKRPSSVDVCTKVV